MKKRALAGRSVGAEFSPSLSPPVSPSLSSSVRSMIAGTTSRLRAWPRMRLALRRLWLGSVFLSFSSVSLNAQAQAPVLCSWGDRISPAAATPPDAKVVQRLLIQSETAYRDRRDTDAAELLYQILAQDPMLERAWFRLGNLMQRTGRPDAALAAYARAASVDPTNEEPHRADRPTRVKASLNFAMLSMQRARDALLRVDSAGLDETTRFIYTGLMERVGDLTSIDHTARAKPSIRRRVVGKLDRPTEAAAAASVVAEIGPSMGTSAMVAVREPGVSSVKTDLKARSLTRATQGKTIGPTFSASDVPTASSVTTAVAAPVIKMVPLANSVPNDDLVNR